MYVSVCACGTYAVLYMRELGSPQKTLDICGLSAPTRILILVVTPMVMIIIQCYILENDFSFLCLLLWTNLVFLFDPTKTRIRSDYKKIPSRAPPN